MADAFDDMSFDDFYQEDITADGGDNGGVDNGGGDNGGGDNGGGDKGGGDNGGGDNGGGDNGGGDNGGGDNGGGDNGGGKKGKTGGGDEITDIFKDVTKGIGVVKDVIDILRPPPAKVPKGADPKTPTRRDDTHYEDVPVDVPTGGKPKPAKSQTEPTRDALDDVAAQVRRALQKLRQGGG